MSEFDPKTYLFTLRIWAGSVDSNQVNWRGKLQALPDGEAYYFQGWEALVNRLETILRSVESDSDQSIENSLGE